MKKLLFILLFFCTFNITKSAEPDKTLHNKCLYPTIQIKPKSRDSVGSAVIVKSVKVSEHEYHNVFITCSHIIHSGDLALAYVYKYKDWSIVDDVDVYFCSFYAKDTVRDIAIGMFISNEEMPTADLGLNEKLYIGNDVYRIGCGIGDEPRLDYGKVTSIEFRPNAKYLSTLRTSVHTIPGDSGGPLFHENKVVGITMAIRVSRERIFHNVSLYTPVKRFLEWSQENEDGYHFVWEDKELPKMPFWAIRFEYRYETIRN